MTPARLLPVLPIILIGAMAGVMADSLSEKQRFPVLIAGLLCSSMGFLVSIPVVAIYFFRLFTAGFPDADKRPGMMIAVGPRSYAPLAWLKIATAVPKGYGVFATLPIAVEMVQVKALVIGLDVFGTGVFFFMMAFSAIARRGSKMHSHLTWYGFMFPNVGLLSAAGSFGSQCVVSVATALLSGVWIFVSAMHVKAIIQRSEYIR